MTRTKPHLYYCTGFHEWLYMPCDDYWLNHLAIQWCMEQDART